MATSRLANLLDLESVEDLSGPKSFERGLDYADDGRVGPVTEADEAIEATVTGAHPYRVRIALDDQEIVGACSCPMGESGAFCKHCVALAVAWAGFADVHPDVIGSPDTLVDAYLDGLDRDELLSLVRDELLRGGDLADRLRLRAAVETAGRADIAVIRQAIDRATHFHDYLDYREVPTFAARIGEVADELEGLIDTGQADVVVELAERAIRNVETAIGLADDSDGYLGELLDRFGAIHLAACVAAKPDPVPLAKRLFEWELNGDFDVFHRAAERYADVLGPTGLAEYRRLVEERLTTLPAGGRHEFAASSMMESLARASGDVDELIDVMSRDLAHAWDYVRIAEVCREAGRPDEAFDWMERGVEAFPQKTDVRLRELLADEYLRRSRPTEAMDLMWAQLVDRPNLESYRLLKGFADRIDAWGMWRDRAIAEVRQAVEEAIAAPPGSNVQLVRPPRRDGSSLVEIFLWEERIDEAWDAAKRLGCGRHVMMSLAKRSEGSRPDDALSVYRDEVDAILSVADRRAYVQAIVLLERMRTFMDGLDRSHEFRAYAAEVRAANVRRPTFRTMFDAAGFD